MPNLVNDSAQQSANPARQKPRICLESSVFSALFGRAEERWKMCRSILQDAREKRIECCVSALVLVECLETSATVAVEGSWQDTVADFFESEFITRCNVDPFVGELARRLGSELSATALTPGQWLWLATAQLQGCSYFMTYEPKLLKLSGQPTLGHLQIMTPCRPWSSGQLSLEDFEGVMDEPTIAALPVLQSPTSNSVSRRAVEI